MHLYKYVSPARIDILKSGRIGFPEPMVFNDPFEMLPHFDSISEEADFQKVFAALAGLGQREKQLIAREIYRQFQVLSPGFLSFREFRRRLNQEWHGIFEDALRKEREFMSSFSAILKLEIGGKIGVLSLTEDCNNLLMWAHYAQNHEGFIVEFDTGHGFFNQGLKKSEEFRCLGRVRYSKQRPSQTYLAELGPMDLFFAKSEEWQYEHEWRFLRSSSSAQRTIATPQGSTYLFSIPPSCITGIILGCRMAPDVRGSLFRVLSGKTRYKHVKIKVAKLDLKEFKLNYLPHEFAVVEPSGP